MSNRILPIANPILAFGWLFLVSVKLHSPVTGLSPLVTKVVKNEERLTLSERGRSKLLTQKGLRIGFDCLSLCSGNQISFRLMSSVGADLFGPKSLLSPLPPVRLFLAFAGSPNPRLPPLRLPVRQTFFMRDKFCPFGDRLCHAIQGRR